MTDDEIQVERRKFDHRAQIHRWFQSAMVSLLVAAVIWGVQTLANLDKSVAAIVPRMDNIEIQASSAYRATDAKRDFADLVRRIDTGDARDAAHDTTLQSLDHRVTKLEARSSAGRYANTRQPAAEARATGKEPPQ